MSKVVLPGRQAAPRVRLIITNVREWRGVKVSSKKRWESGDNQYIFAEFTTPF
jgi:hypothetical protein